MCSFWDRGQPDDWDYMENGEDCGQLHASETRKRKKWNDADCNLEYQYICEARQWETVAVSELHNSPDMSKKLQQINTSLTLYMWLNGAKVADPVHLWCFGQ